MKTRFFLMLLMLSVQYLSAQNITVSIPVIIANPGETVSVPVTVVSGASSSGTPVGACDLNINYDDDVLTFIGLANFFAGMPAGEWIYSGNQSMVAANWIDGALLTEAIPDGTTLFEMQFTYNGGNSPLTFSKNEFYDANYLLIPTTPLNGAVNPEIILHDVTFLVDMSREEISAGGVHLAGSFNGWDYDANPMTSIGNGIYSATIQLEENSTHTYRFVNGNSSAGLETVPEECGVLSGSGDYEREVTTGNSPMTIDTVCFELCTSCPPLHSVTFRVDMINEEVSVDGMHLAGTFNNWSYSATPMTLTGAGAVYEVTLDLEEGSYQEFKFVNGNSPAEAEVVPEGCASNGNRYITIPSDNLALDAYCFGECVTCGEVPEFFTVTFRVDMMNEQVSANGVHIAGSFQGWQPGTTLMTNTSGSYYEYSLTILEGSSVEYRFVNGNTSGGYETVPAQCSIGENRFLNNIAQDTILPLVCFSACDSCVMPVVKVTFRVDLSGEGVVISPDGIHLSGSFQGWDPSATQMTEVGMGIYTAELMLAAGSHQEYRFVNGNSEAGLETVPEECAQGLNRFVEVPENDTILDVVCFASCEPCPVATDLHTSSAKQLIIYPNPVTETANLSFNLENAQLVSVMVFNHQGSLIQETCRQFFQQGNHMLKMPVIHYSGGVYLIVLRGSDNRIISQAKMLVAGTR